MSGWIKVYHLSGNSSGLRAIEEYNPVLDVIIPTWVVIKADGSIIEYISSRDKVIFNYFNDNQIVPLVQNYKLDSAISNKLLSDKKAIKNGVKNLFIYLKEKGYKALNLDLEGVSIGNKQNYNLFVEELVDAMAEQDYKLSLSIPAKTENNNDSSWSGAYNYSILGRLADEIFIMAYDYHWSGGSPGPVAPIKWVQDVIDYAIIEIPLEKIVLGIPFYGYDWTLDSNSRAKGVTYPMVVNLQDRFNCQQEWDQESQTPYLKYENNEEKHEVWFENKESIKKKINLVKEYQLAGAAFWRIGQEDEQIWQFLGGE